MVYFTLFDLLPPAGLSLFETGDAALASLFPQNWGKKDFVSFGSNFLRLVAVTRSLG